MKKLILASAALLFVAAFKNAPPTTEGVSVPSDKTGSQQVSLALPAVSNFDRFHITAPATVLDGSKLNLFGTKANNSEVNAPLGKVAKANTGIGETQLLDKVQGTPFAAKKQGIIQPADAGGDSLVITITSTSLALKDSRGDPKVGMVIRAAAAPSTTQITADLAPIDQTIVTQSGFEAAS